MSARAAILDRIREALRLSAPPPGSHEPGAHGPGAGHAAGVEDGAFREWLPAVGPAIGDWIALFAACSENLRTRFIVCDSEAEAAQQVRAIAAEDRWSRIASHRADPVRAVAGAAGVPVLWTDGGYEPGALEACDAGLSGCDALVAQTGGVLLTARSGGGRALSVLPPHHLVVARRSQMVPDLPAAFALLTTRYGADYPSMMTFITGPSRTGDIERILVLGAHGPRKLTVLLVP